MDNIPYDMWTDQITDRLHKYGINSGIVADLGCGTGSLTEMLARRGYDMIGIDNSVDMLQEAIGKRDRSGSEILYLNQDMSAFELYGTCAAMVSRCDSLNYLTRKEDLKSCFRLVNNYLDPKGIFIFDMKTEFMYKEILGSNTFARNNDSGSYIWENYYDANSKINQYLLTIYSTDMYGANAGGGEAEATGANAGEVYTRSEELHEQRAYSIDELRELADYAGLKWLEAVDADNEGDIEPDTARYLITLQEQGK